MFVGYAWTEKITCIHCGSKVRYCGCIAEFFGPGHDEEHCVCDNCKIKEEEKHYGP